MGITQRPGQILPNRAQPVGGLTKGIKGKSAGLNDASIHISKSKKIKALGGIRGKGQ